MPKASTKKTKSITEFMWLKFPKATFATIRCPASSQRAGFRVFSGKKNPSSKSHLGKHTQNTVLTAIFYHLSRMGAVPYAIRSAPGVERLGFARTPRLAYGESEEAARGVSLVAHSFMRVFVSPITPRRDPVGGGLYRGKKENPKKGGLFGR